MNRFTIRYNAATSQSQQHNFSANGYFERHNVTANTYPDAIRSITRECGGNPTWQVVHHGRVLSQSERLDAGLHE